MIKHGVVSSVQAKFCSVRVNFSDRDNLVSAWLPVLQPACAGNKFFSLPKVGDNVVCVFEHNCDDGTGFVLGSFYNDKNRPPSTNKKSVVIKFEDGAEIRYASGKLTISGVDEINITCGEKFKVRAPTIDIKEG